MSHSHHEELPNIEKMRKGVRTCEISYGGWAAFHIQTSVDSESDVAQQPSLCSRAIISRR